MVFKIKNVFLLIILILLQSCAGGRVGNFLESSFKNIKEPKIKEDAKNKIVIKSEGNTEKNKNVKEPKIKEDAKNKIVIKSEGNTEKNKNVKEPKIKEDTKNKIVIKSEGNTEKNKNVKDPKIKENAKNNLKNNKVITLEEKSKKNKKITKQNISRLKRKYQPQSYKIIFILKDVDPKDPIENLSTILRNSDVNFEIEKIERFLDSKNKIIKRN